MVQGTMSEQTRVWRLMAAHAWRSTLGWLHGGPLLRWRPLAPNSDTLLIAPQDIRTTDPTIAEEIYAGRFTFAGQVVEAAGQSPFQADSPSDDWERGLHGFGWLRHLRAADSAIFRANARALIDDWIRHRGRAHAAAWDPHVTARRVLSWLAQSPVLLEDCELDFYRRFVRSLGRQVRYLRRTINETPDGLERMRVAIALSAASLSISGQTRFARQCARRLDHEIARQILGDGGHISRNPAELVAILTDLLPVRQAMIARGTAPSSDVMNAVDRMMPMIRFFRHRDGALAHFNGMGATPRDLIATILAYDDTRGSPLAGAPHSGYQRLEAGKSVLIIDTGSPPPTAHSGEAHAGCLSFEFSSGTKRLIVNCGTPSVNNSRLRQVARSTAAHSTLVVKDTSSCRFLSKPGLVRYLGAPVISGPGRVTVTREDPDSGPQITASHDGYSDAFGLIHERTVTLAPDGTNVIGVDRLTGKLGADTPFAIRFHLHPSVKASRVRGGDTVLLVPGGGDVWEFHAPEQDIDVEESIYFFDDHGQRRTDQIVIYGQTDQVSDVAWSFVKVEQDKPSATAAEPTNKLL